MLTEQQKKVCAFGIPLVLALGAAVTQSIAIQRSVQTGRFLVLKNKLNEGETLERSNLLSIEIAERFIPQGAIRSENLEATIKTKARRSLSPGKLLFADDITGSLRRLDPDKGEKAIPILINRQLISTQNLDVGDHIFILAAATRTTDGQPLEYPEYGPYRILQIAEREGSDDRFQRLELAIPNEGISAIIELNGQNSTQKIINLREARQKN